jgi:cell division protein FtsI (penicillin-binding protein 3)
MDGFRLWVSVTPMQTLAFYNAVANNGVMVKPQFVSEIKEWNKTIKKWIKR